MTDVKIEGGCDCGHIRYQLMNKPLFVHCCHCTWCQRETGSAFALNAIIETSNVKVTKDSPVLIDTPTESGKGQKIARCPNCQVAVWSHYLGLGEVTAFVKVGTLDDANHAPPDINIFTRSKLDWVRLSDSIPCFEAYYDKNNLWPKDSLDRLKNLKRNN